MNKPKNSLLAGGAVAAVLLLSMLGAASGPAQASTGSGKVTSTHAGRSGESGARTSAPSWGWPVGW
jgi:hypothetical protein